MISSIGSLDCILTIILLTTTHALALLIHFYPKLYATPVPIPSPCVINSQPSPFDPPVFVVSNSIIHIDSALVVADKHATAPRNYNLRVVECKLSAAILSKLLGITNCDTLRIVADTYIKTQVELGELNADIIGPGNKVSVLDIMIGLVRKHLHTHSHTYSELSQLGDIDAIIGDIKIETDEFELYKRAMHVYTEARRVFLFVAVCNGSVATTQLNKTLGELMNASQDSCRDMFGCSCTEIDSLVNVCRSFGAFGSRLTGAGWGGCVVSLVAQSRAVEFVQKLKDEYYTDEMLSKYGKSRECLDEYVFYSTPGSGSLVFKY